MEPAARAALDQQGADFAQHMRTVHGVDLIDPETRRVAHELIVELSSAVGVGGVWGLLNFLASASTALGIPIDIETRYEEDPEP